MITLENTVRGTVSALTGLRPSVRLYFDCVIQVMATIGE
jgi:hypothetical protein